MSKLVGNKPSQVPTNADLGTLAYQDKDDYIKSYGDISLTGDVDIATGKKLGVGTSSPAAAVHVNTSTNTPLLVESTHGDGGYVELQLSDSGGAGSLTGYIGDSQALIASGDAGDLAIRAQSDFVVSTGGSTQTFKIQSDGQAELKGSSTGLTLNRTGDNAWLGFSNNGTYTGFIYGSTNEGIRFFVADGSGAHPQRVRFAPNGDVYMGTTVVQGQGGLTFDKGTRGYNQTFNQSSHVNGNEFITFRNTNTQIGSISADSASSTSFNTSSDYRLKENVTYDWDATTRLKQLKPARFNWIADESNTLVDGFIAHEVSSVVPNAVTGNKDATETYADEDGNEQTRIKPQQIDHGKLVPLLVKTIQELEARITELENA